MVANRWWVDVFLALGCTRLFIGLEALLGRAARLGLSGIRWIRNRRAGSTGRRLSARASPSSGCPKGRPLRRWSRTRAHCRLTLGVLRGESRTLRDRRRYAGRAWDWEGPPLNCRLELVSKHSDKAAITSGTTIAASTNPRRCLRHRLRIVSLRLHAPDPISLLAEVLKPALNRSRQSHGTRRETE